MKNISQTLKSLTIALILVGGISYVFAWTGPSTTPPNGNVSAPINIGSTSQSKNGALSLGTSNPPTTGYSLDVTGAGVFSAGVASNQFCLGTNCITSWPSGGGVPSGAVMAFNLSSCPSGWSAFTQGAGRVILGTGDSVTTGSASHTLLQQGGEEKHLQTSSELAVHSHASYYQVSSAVNTSGASGGGSWAFTKQFGEAGAWTNTGNTPASGTQVPMPIMNPYIALLYCQKN